VVIDGTTQPPAPAAPADSPLIQIDGSSVSGDGLTFDSGSDGSIVRDLAIVRFSGNAIVLNSGSNTIGGTAPGVANVIAANRNFGIEILSSNNLVQGNFIGTDASGATGLGNGLGVAMVDGASGNTIGGTAPGAANVIAANRAAGIFLLGTGTSNNLVQGNFIGTNASSATGLGNGGDGAEIVLGASGNTIGGTVPGAGNVIADNQKGVVIGLRRADAATGNAVLGNAIFANTLLGIDLGNDGVTLNDSSGHAGPNLFQDFPVLTAAASSASGTTIAGTVQGPANSTLRVELFANAAADPSGYGQGQIFLGFVAVATDGSGNGTFSFTTPSVIAPGQVIAATATDAAGNTSEFSQDLTVVAAVTSPDPVASSGPNLNPLTGGPSETETLTPTNTGATAVAKPFPVVLTSRRRE
jgi:titin